jgi:hypothetical protein
LSLILPTYLLLPWIPGSNICTFCRIKSKLHFTICMHTKKQILDSILPFIFIKFHTSSSSAQISVSALKLNKLCCRPICIQCKRSTHVGCLEKVKHTHRCVSTQTVI